MANNKMIPVKDNRSYIKGLGACVNIDSQAYKARLNKLRAERIKNKRIVELESELSQMKDIMTQVLKQVNINGN